MRSALYLRGARHFDQFETENTLMTNNPNELTIENSALVLIDHQPAVGLAVHSIDQGLLVTNVSSLAQAAKALGVPTVLSTIGAQGSVLVDPIFQEISDVFPEITPIDRTSTHAWSDPKFRAAVNATGRKKLIMAGIVDRSTHYLHASHPSWPRGLQKSSCKDFSL
jgi:hypothetical protein